LRDDSLTHIRPVRPDDAEALLVFLRSLPDEDWRFRFFSLGNDLARVARDETDVDYVQSLGLLATVGPQQRIVGHELYARDGDDERSLPLQLPASIRGQGLATLLPPSEVRRQDVERVLIGQVHPLARGRESAPARC
jgi:hypothetical protein